MSNQGRGRKGGEGMVTMEDGYLKPKYGIYAKCSLFSNPITCGFLF